jgi:copper(I)-binding protein
VKGVQLMLLIACISTPALACKGLEIEDGWIRQAPPGANVMAGYVRIKNNSDRPRRITAITSPRFGAIEVHETVIENGESQMRALDTLNVPAHGETTLEPGGKHLMLFRPTAPQPTTGDTASLRFRCGKSRPVTAKFIVKATP